MNSYFLRQESETSSSRACRVSPVIAPFIIAGIVAQSLQPTAVYPSYNIVQNPKTVGQLENIFTGDYAYGVSDFDASMTAFYATLLEKQEPLGKEFEDVLNEIRWDLYVRS